MDKTYPFQKETIFRCSIKCLTMELEKITEGTIPELLPDDSALPYTNHYEPIAKIGSGRLGDVYLARDITNDEHLAVKMARNKKSIPFFQHEALALSHLSHPNIIAFRGYYISQDGLPVLITEYCKGEPLSHALHTHGALDELTTRIIGREITAALHYMHSQDILHRDVKPGNIYCAPDGFKLLDFNSAYLPITTHLHSVLLSKGYVAPEIASFMKQKRPLTQERWMKFLSLLTPAIDFYALGVTLYACLQGTSIYPEMFEKPTPQIGPDFARILSGLLSENPHQRMEAAEEL